MRKNIFSVSSHSEDKIFLLIQVCANIAQFNLLYNAIKKLLKILSEIRDAIIMTNSRAIKPLWD